MKRLIVAALLGSAAVLSGCEEPAPAEVETAQPPVEAMPEPPEPQAAAPAEKAPSDSSRLPPDHRASEETVQPESETLFY